MVERKFWQTTGCAEITEWRDQKFHPRPIPSLFSRPNISEIYTETFFSKQNVFETDSETYFATKYFWDQYWDFFLALILRLFLDQIFRDRYRYSQKMREFSIPRSLNTEKSRDVTLWLKLGQTSSIKSFDALLSGNLWFRPGKLIFDK